MSAAVPEALEGLSRGGDSLGESVFNPRDIIYISDRDVHVPSWYIPHENADKITVTRDGAPLPCPAGRSFTVSEVAPEHRWAIQPDGEVLPQHIFEGKLLLVREEFFIKAKGQKVPQGLKNRHTPTVARYVSQTVDPTNPRRLMDIGYAEAEAAARGAAPDVLWDKDGENPASGDERMAMLLRAYASKSLRAALTEREIAEVEAHMGVESGSGTGGVMAKLEELNQMLAEGDITGEVHSKRVAALTGSVPEIPAPVEVTDEKPVKRGPGRPRKHPKE